MAKEKALVNKQRIVEEIKKNIDSSSSLVLFDYRGISDGEAKEIRRKLREENADYKVYKNTLMQIAFKDLGIDVESELVGPSALAFSEDQLAPIKILSDFAKRNKNLDIKIAVVDKEVTNKEKIQKLASIPSREGLLTMLAGSLIAIPKDLAICLDLYAKEKEKSEVGGN